MKIKSEEKIDVVKRQRTGQGLFVVSAQNPQIEIFSPYPSLFILLSPWCLEQDKLALDLTRPHL